MYESSDKQTPLIIYLIQNIKNFGTVLASSIIYFLCMILGSVGESATPLWMDCQFSSISLLLLLLILLILLSLLLLTL